MGGGEPLFTDDMKFESHCGWPSFDKEIEGRKIIQAEHNIHGMRRTEITSAQCKGHLGPIFDDGPTKTRIHSSVNSASLSFEPQKANISKNTTETITLAGACFWCTEAIFEKLKGVSKIELGYSNRIVKNPSYNHELHNEQPYCKTVIKPKMDKLHKILLIN
jgi:peptide methionine sulfoxide reductase msrA/msrB